MAGLWRSQTEIKCSAIDLTYSYSDLLSLAVIRDASVVQLDVDSEANHVVGPLNSGAQISRTPVFVGGAPGK